MEVMRYMMQGAPPTVEDDFVAIVDPNGVGPELGFQRVAEAKVTKNRVHLDLLVDNRDAEVSRLVALGGMEAQTFRDGAWTVMTDPEGNEFCLVTG
jgi:predicted enzyme related to lactoylglutathione lyase